MVRVNPLTHIDLFSGIGGFALAARWAGLETVQFVEIDPFCQKVLKKHWPEVPIHDDVTTFQWDGVRPFLLTGGFPCQPFSTAKHGKRGNVRDYSQTCIKVLSAIIPKYAIIENVDRRVIEEVASGLRNAGFGALVRRYNASHIGAWHRRNRWFVIAHPHNKGEFQSRLDEKMAVMPSLENCVWREPDYPRAIRMDDGIPRGVDRTNRLKALGNAIVPQIAYEIIKSIVEIDNEKGKEG